MLNIRQTVKILTNPSLPLVRHSHVPHAEEKQPRHAKHSNYQEVEPLTRSSRAKEAGKGGSACWKLRRPPSMTNEKFTRPLMYRIVITFHGQAIYLIARKRNRVESRRQKNTRGDIVLQSVGQSRRQPRASEQKRYKVSSINRDSNLGEFSMEYFARESWDLGQVWKFGRGCYLLVIRIC